MIARKRPRPQPDDDNDDEHRKCLRIVTFDSTIDSEIMETKSFIARLHKVSSPDENYLIVYRVNRHFRAYNYLMERLYEACGVCILELKDGTVIYMLVERKYPLSKELLQQMLDLGLEVEEESTAALQLVKIYSVKRSNNEFEMSMMGELNFFLGLQIKQMEDGIFFNQSKYIKEMLKKFGLEDSKPMKTPMSSDTKLMKDEKCESVDSTKYRGMIGSLLYLTASRPDIMFSVCLCARFQEGPKTYHLKAVKCIFQYIKGTTHLGLWYPKGTRIETVIYVDYDHAGDYVDRKSNRGNMEMEPDIENMTMNEYLEYEAAKERQLLLLLISHTYKNSINLPFHS
ncbi:uncharacterized mitochondrial protein-like protein [Tanacetum coccineum]|uniref:Uncharacterized mitochondrial protein-like protein n=1 Tax=Tanacetum coccineum TaxID=301880 RepID=A0ABQ5EZ74_9ASTR